MNLRFLLRWIFIGAFLVASVNAAIGLGLARRTEAALQDILVHRYEEQLRQTTEVLRNELLQGDIRGARVHLESILAAHEIVGYRILQNGQMAEDSSGYDEITRSDGVTEIPVMVRFSQGGAQWGRIRYAVSLLELKSLSRSLFRSVLFNGVLTIFLSLLGFFVFAQFLLAASRELYPLLERLSRNEAPGRIGNFAFQVWKPLVEVLTDTANKLRRLQEESIRSQRDKAIGEQAVQVAHDIRSPLASLNSVIQNAQSIDEVSRAQVRAAANRIRDIASGLLARNRDITNTETDAPVKLIMTSTELRTVELLSALLDSAVSQKRLQYGDRSGLRLGFEVNGDGLVLFSEIQPTEVHRVISNLINNSVESLPGAGKIEVSLKRSGNSALIRVKDNGKGIPPELLSKVVERGGTFGKKDGNGLGLSHAKATIESWGGKFNLESALGQGTTVTLELPLVDTPRWFPKSLGIKAGMTVVIADDDPSIHQVWNDRLRGEDLTLVHLHTPKEILSWYRENLLVNDVLYLCDHEFTGHDQNGIDLIEATGIAPQAILVTNSWDEALIRSRCEKIGLRLLPKTLIGSIQIS